MEKKCFEPHEHLTKVSSKEPVLKLVKLVAVPYSSQHESLTDTADSTEAVVTSKQQQHGESGRGTQHCPLRSWEGHRMKRNRAGETHLTESGIPNACVPQPSMLRYEATPNRRNTRSFLHLNTDLQPAPKGGCRLCYRGSVAILVERAQQGQVLGSSGWGHRGVLGENLRAGSGLPGSFLALNPPALKGSSS